MWLCLSLDLDVTIVVIGVHVTDPLFVVIVVTACNFCCLTFNVQRFSLEAKVMSAVR